MWMVGPGRGWGGLSWAPISEAEMCPLHLPHINSTEKSLRGVVLTAASPRPARSPAHRTHAIIRVPASLKGAEKTDLCQMSDN